MRFFIEKHEEVEADEDDARINEYERASKKHCFAQQNTKNTEVHWVPRALVDSLNNKDLRRVERRRSSLPTNREGPDTVSIESCPTQPQEASEDRPCRNGRPTEGAGLPEEQIRYANHHRSWYQDRKKDDL